MIHAITTPQRKRKNSGNLNTLNLHALDLANKRAIFVLRNKPQVAAVLGLVVAGIVLGAIVGLLDVPKPWTYVVVAIFAAIAVALMMRRFHR